RMGPEFEAAFSPWSPPHHRAGLRRTSSRAARALAQADVHVAEIVHTRPLSGKNYDCRGRLLDDGGPFDLGARVQQAALEDRGLDRTCLVKVHRSPSANGFLEPPTAPL